MRHVALITTGGTIEKTYDEVTGSLENRQSIVRAMLAQLRLEQIELTITDLMSKDSLHMDDEDRDTITDAVRRALEPSSPEVPVRGVVVLHGTDTLAVTGERIYEAIPCPSRPIILTGAMRPFEMTKSDALQNLTESIFAAGVAEPGVYCCFHGNLLRFPGVVKDRARSTFVMRSGTSTTA